MFSLSVFDLFWALLLVSEYTPPSNKSDVEAEHLMGGKSWKDVWGLFDRFLFFILRFSLGIKFIFLQKFNHFVSYELADSDRLFVSFLGCLVASTSSVSVYCGNVLPRVRDSSWLFHFSACLIRFLRWASGLHVTVFSFGKNLRSNADSVLLLEVLNFKAGCWCFDAS